MSNLNEKLIVVLEGKDSSLSSTFKTAGKNADKLSKDIENVGKTDLGKVGSNFLGKLKEIGADTSLGKMTSDITAGASAFEAMAGPVAIAAGAVIGFTSAGVKLGTTLFDMAKDASEFGSKLYDMQQRTGLASDTLSAMDLAANQSGTSLEAVGDSTAKFSKLIGEAAGGSKDAQAKLKALGVTSNDLDTALGQAYKTINKLPEGFAQNNAAMDAFGRSGAALLPFIKGMDGDLAGLKKKASELGVTLTDEDLKAADAFGDQLDLLSQQAKVTGAKFALEFAPDITDAMGDVSKAFSDNKDLVRAWGREVGDVIKGVVAEVKELNDPDSVAQSSWTKGILNYLSYVGGVRSMVEILAKKGKEAREKEAAQWKNVPIFGDPKDGVLLKDRPRTAGSDYLKDRNAAGASKDSPLKRAGEDAKNLESQLYKNIKIAGIELDAVLKNVQVSEAQKVAIDLQGKGYDHLIPAKYNHILALARERDAITATLDENKKLIDSYKSATDHLKDFYAEQINSISATDTSINRFAGGLQRIEGIFENIEKFQAKFAGSIGGDGAAAQPIGSAAAGKASMNWRELKRFAEEHGFDVTSTTGGKHNAGSLHPLGWAVDVRTRDKSKAEIEEFMATARAAGINVRDERKRPKNQKEWGGPHLHLSGLNLKQPFAEALPLAKELAGATFDIAKNVKGYGVEGQKNEARQIYAQAEIGKLVFGLQKDYDGLIGKETTATEEVGKFLDEARAAGLEFSKISEETAKHLGFQIDAFKFEEKINVLAKDHLQTQINLRNESYGVLKNEEGINNELRERLGLKPTNNFGIKPPEAKPEIFTENAPQVAVGIDSFWKQYKTAQADQGALFNPDDIGVKISALEELKATALDAFGGIAQGLGSVLDAWILTGEMSGAAIAKMTASIISGIAAQAGVKAIFEVAEGFAASAIGDVKAAALHFTAAKIYGGVALAATATAVGIGAAGGLRGGKDKEGIGAGAGRVNDSSSNYAAPEKTNYIRQSSANNFFNPDRQRQMLEQRISELSENVARLAKLSDIVESSKPGDVLVRGAGQKKGFIIETVTNELSKNSTQKGTMNRVLGNT